MNDQRSPAYDRPERAFGLGCVPPGTILPPGVTPLTMDSSEPQIAQRLDALRSRAIDVRDEVNRLQVRLTSVSRPPVPSPDKPEPTVLPPNDVPVARVITEVILVLLETKETVARILDHLEVP